MEVYDYLIVGGGLFGVYAAIYISRKGHRILLVEKEPELFKKASIVNQARLHAGYHYPRSIATAKLANEHKERFTREHRQFINFKFDKYYAIEKHGSFTNSAQFKRFCDFLSLKARRVSSHRLFNLSNIEDLYLTEEYSFDPVLIAEYYKELLKAESNAHVKVNCNVAESYREHDSWHVKILSRGDSGGCWIKAYSVINATYTGTNTVNAIFKVKSINLVHQITEIAMISSPSLQNVGLTIMDGSFCSLMPYGLSNLFSLSSVKYTHHKTSFENDPVFDCQKLNKDCKPDYYSICNRCYERPKTNYYKMICQIKKYLADEIEPKYIFSLYTIKSKLQSSYIDDGRPTEISLLNNKPPYYCLFAGKVNSIYEIESEVTSV